MLRIATDGIAWCISHNRESCKSGWTNRDAIWDIDSGGLNKPCIRWESRSPHMKRQSWGREGAGQGHAGWSIYSKQLSSGQIQYSADADWVY